MKINLVDLSDRIIQMKNLKEDYELMLLNYYNSTKDIEENWNNNKAKKLLGFIEDEKKDTNKILNNIDDVIKVYEFIYKKYSPIGKVFRIKLGKKEEIMDSINDCIDRINKIIDRYKTIDLNQFDSQKVLIIREENNILNKELEMLNTIKTSLKKNFSLVEKNEKDIKSKISKIKIDFVSETDISGAIEK